MNELDVQLLEVYLDGELDEAASADLRRRLADEPALAEALEELIAERDLRLSAFTSLEGDEPAIARVMDTLQGAIRHDRRATLIWRSMRYVAAAAACLTIGLLAAHFRNRPHPIAHGTDSGPAPVYSVAITDEAGRVMAVQKFESLEKARAFSEDLQRSEERLQQLRTGMVTVRSARF